MSFGQGGLFGAVKRICGVYDLGYGVHIFFQFRFRPVAL
jgi:hypothetical protein